MTHRTKRDPMQTDEAEARKDFDICNALYGDAPKCDKRRARRERRIKRIHETLRQCRILDTADPPKTTRTGIHWVVPVVFRRK